jgi:hypothetical protein
LGPFPSQFTTVNDAAMNYVLPAIAREQRENIATLETDLNHIGDPAGHDLVAELLRLKRQHLPEIEALAPQPSTVWK